MSTSGERVFVDAAELLGVHEAPGPEHGVELAEHVLSRLREHKVDLDLRGMSGVTTAFANAMFQTLFAALPEATVKAGLAIRMRTGVQQEVLRRSLESTRPAAA